MDVRSQPGDRRVRLSGHQGTCKKTAMHEDDAKGAAVSMKPMEMRENAHRRISRLLLTMADVRKLPRVEMITEFKCIEGWSEIVYWGGVRLRDFLEAFPPRIENASQLHPSEFVNSFPEYIDFQTIQDLPNSSRRLVNSRHMVSMQIHQMQRTVPLHPLKVAL